MAGDPREHPRADLVSVVEGEDIVGPSDALEDPM
jgi:hypothetical protein